MTSTDSLLVPLPHIATICFAFAVIHTFLVSRFRHIATRFPNGSTGENLFHLLGEVEVSFGLWAAVYLLAVVLAGGSQHALEYLGSREFREPIFVFVIMAVCSTKPIMELAKLIIGLIARLLESLLPVKRVTALYITTMILGPLLGSFITEPAAMTVTALIVLEQFYRLGVSRRFQYATLGLLFVSVSIGGTLTPYAAPPVLMVAKTWNWDLAFMLTHFGWRAALSILVSTLAVVMVFKKEFGSLNVKMSELSFRPSVPSWVIVIHLLMLTLIVLIHHHTVAFVGLFLLFLGLVAVTKEYQTPMRLEQGLLVAFFLGGIVVLGEPQRWWLEPLLSNMSAGELFAGATALTSVTDNAALAYLGGQIPGLSEISKYALLAGSVVGGGLTVIANAPNPAGFGILNESFGEDGIKPLLLLAAALPFTLVAAAFFLADIGD